MNLAVQPRLMEKTRASLSLVLLPCHGKGWGTLQKTKLSLRPSSFTLYPVGSCAHEMQKEHVVISAKKELRPHTYLRLKSIGLLQAGYGERRKH